MPPTQLKTNEKDVSMLDYSGMADKLIIQAKKELEDIKNQILLENVHLTKLRDKKIKDENELESWKRAEKLKFTNDMVKIQNDIISKQNEINLHVQQQVRITQDLQTQQQKFEGLRAEQIKFKEDLVKLEGQKIQVQEAIKQAESMRADALSERNKVEMVHQEALQMQEKNKQENIRLTNLNDALSQREKKIDEDYKSLQTLRDFVEPKIKDIESQTIHLEDARKKNQETIDQLNSKMNEEKVLLQSILDKKAQQEKDLKDLESQKQEFSREQLLSKVNK